jgi:hypothetical protein
MVSTIHIGSKSGINNNRSCFRIGSPGRLVASVAQSGRTSESAVTHIESHVFYEEFPIESEQLAPSGLFWMQCVANTPRFQEVGYIAAFLFFTSKRSESSSTHE